METVTVGALIKRHQSAPEPGTPGAEDRARTGPQRLGNHYVLDVDRNLVSRLTLISKKWGASSACSIRTRRGIGERYNGPVVSSDILVPQPEPLEETTYLGEFLFNLGATPIRRFGQVSCFRS